MARNTKKKTKTQKQVYNSLNLSIRIGINIILLILLVQAFFFAYRFSYNVFSNPAYNERDDREIAVTIAPGSSSMEVASLLEEEGLVESKMVAFVRAKITKTTVMPGTYVLKPSMTMDEIYGVLGNTTKEEET